MILGSCPGKEGLYVATGHEGDGVALAPITGELVSSFICQNKDESSLIELSPRRFTEQSA